MRPPEGPRDTAQPVGVTRREAASSSLSPQFLDALRAFLDQAFDGEFADHDWQHALGGIHVWLARPSGELVSHGSLVARTIHVGSRALHAGYLEAIATAPGVRGRGYGSAVLARLGELIRERYALGMLSTGSHAFYERLGWARWRGRTGFDGRHGIVWTPDDDDSVMILRTPASPEIDFAADIVADWRPGDVW